MKHADFLSSCSESLKEWTIQNLGVDSNKIEVIYNPIELPTHKVELKSSTVKPTIVFVGTISDVKGCGDLFEAGKLLAEKMWILICFSMVRWVSLQKILK